MHVLRALFNMENTHLSVSCSCLAPRVRSSSGRCAWDLAGLGPATWGSPPRQTFYLLLFSLRDFWKRSIFFFIIFHLHELSSTWDCGFVQLRSSRRKKVHVGRRRRSSSCWTTSGHWNLSSIFEWSAESKKISLIIWLKHNPFFFHFTNLILVGNKVSTLFPFWKSPLIYLTSKYLYLL